MDEAQDHDRGGRPTKLTEGLIAAVIELIRQFNFREVAARSLGFTPRSFRRWMSLGRSAPGGIYGRFRRAVLQAESEAEQSAVKLIIEAGKTVDPKHLEWWLERRFPHRWSKGRSELWALKKELAELRKMIQNEPGTAG